MNPEAAQLALRIFRSALELASADRTAFLERVCGGDRAMQTEVESLLAADARAGRFLEAGANAGARTPPVGPGCRLSHYLIEREIGAGGMGRVYLARDVALGRPAAIKVVRRQVAPGHRALLLREAEASARLQHPAIATFYEAGEADGVAFIAMEYVEGQTLRRRLADGPLPPDEAVAMVECILEALAHAHGAGLLHRDIKPENIMVTGTRSAKLLDFGIAREALCDGTAGDAAPGRSLMAGTAGYMAPEQVRGEALDARCDLFAAGAVLYEALTGRMAFPGDGVEQCIARVLSSDVPPMQSRGVTDGIARVLERAMARDRDQRYPSASVFLSALRSLRDGESLAGLPQTLAVLPLENLRGDGDDGWIGSGTAESVAASLGRAPGLEVVPAEKIRGTLARLTEARQPCDALALGLALGCRWVIAGSFQRMGGTLRLTVRLIEVATGRVAHAENLDGEVDRLFQLQDRLSSAVLSPLSVRGPERNVQPTLDAYECYARGRLLFTAAQRGSLEQAGDMFRQAIALDPAYGPAYTGLAGCQAMHFPAFTDERDLEAACDNARRAAEMTPTDSEAYVWIGYALLRRARYDEALRTLHDAVALDPDNLFAHYFAGACLEAAGRCGEAIEHYQRCVAIGPLFGWGWLGLGWSHMELGDLGSATWCLRRASELEQSGHSFTPGVEGHLAECLRRAGKLSEARRAALEGLESTEKSDSWYRDTFRGVCLAALGRTALDQEDREAARAAFLQCVLLHRGRPCALGCGHLVVQALAGLARSEGNAARLEEALALFRARGPYSFHWVWGCSDDLSRADLSRAAREFSRE